MSDRLLIILLIIAIITLSKFCDAGIPEWKAVRAIVGEASDQGYMGMLDLASGIRNRGTLHGVCGVNAKHIDTEPVWVFDMALRAWRESEQYRTHTGTHWGSLKLKKDIDMIRDLLNEGYVEVHRRKDHVFLLRGEV